MPAMKELVRGVERYRHFIGGQWVESTVREWIDVENPVMPQVCNGKREAELNRPDESPD